MGAAEVRRRCTVVIGGSRCSVGRSLVQRLLKLDYYCLLRIALFNHDDPHHHNYDDEALLSSSSSSFVRLDPRSPSQIIRAIEGSSVVFFVVESTTTSSSSSSSMYDDDDFYRCYTLIVQGAKNVINACRQCKVKRLIYSSCADVVVSNGFYDINNGDESLPYASKYKNMLIDLNAQAEALVLFANDIDSLLTCALRPSNVFGPGDMDIIPLLVKGAKFGWTKFILGSGENRCDFTYMENVAHALICADEALSTKMAFVAGKAFFITNIEPVKFWDLVSSILEGMGYQRPMIKIPVVLARSIILLNKWMNAKLHPAKLNHHVAVDNFLELSLCTRTFNCTAAHKHIGYSPVVSLKEGVAVTIESFSCLAKDKICLKQGDFDEPSNAEMLLGSARVADILLWRDEKKSFTCFLALVALCYSVSTLEENFVSSVAKLLLLVVAIILGYGFLPSNMFGLTLQRIPVPCFDISELDMLNVVTVIAYMWNRLVAVARTLAQGKDWSLYLKVIFSFYIFKFIWSLCLTAVVGVGIVLAFTLFFIYDQYEEETDEIAKFLHGTANEALGLLKKNTLITLPSCLYSIKRQKACHEK